MDVVMPCYLVNEELIELTKSAIDSLGEVNLIIIDNGSPIGGGLLREKADIYIRNKENLGYAKAVNQGLRLCRGSHIAVSNNDIRVSPNWQEVAREVFVSDPLVYSCHFRMGDYTQPITCGEKVAFTGKERWCTSSFFVIRNRNIRYFDEHYGIGGFEDYDYWYRTYLAGQKTAYTDKAWYQHKHSSTQNSLSQEERKTRDKSSQEYFKFRFGEYPDKAMEKMFPEQWKIPYWEGFNL